MLLVNTDFGGGGVLENETVEYIYLSSLFFKLANQSTVNTLNIFGYSVGESGYPE